MAFYRELKTGDVSRAEALRRAQAVLIENDRSAGEAIEPYLSERGYRKFHRQKINDFYLRDDGATDDLTLADFELPPD